MSLFFLIAITLIIFTGCGKPPIKQAVLRGDSLYRLRPAAYPIFSDTMSLSGLSESIEKSLSYFHKLPGDRSFRYGQDSYDADHIIKSLEAFHSFIAQNPSSKELDHFISQNYIVYQSVGGDEAGEVMFTGYYEPLINGSPERTPEYSVPVFARPDDLVIIDLSKFSDHYKGRKITGRYTGETVEPYYTREEIEKTDMLNGQAAVLAWIKDPVDLFFLQVQGSGKIFMNNGETVNVHYHTANGQPYRSIGKLLIDEQAIPQSEMSMQRIRQFLNENPESAERIMNYNPSYVFFKIEEEGPIGSIGVKLTPMRSIALDRKIFPKGGLAFIKSNIPLVDGDEDIKQWYDFSGFVLNQDTGGAIRGPGRCDMFWGNGSYAEIAAGHIQHMGALYFLVLKPDAVAKK